MSGDISMSSSILSDNGYKKQILHICEHDGTAAIETITDIEPVINHVQQMKETHRGFKSQTANYVGTIPLDIFRKWGEVKGITNHELMTNNKYLADFLNDPDFAKFKAIDGKV